MLAWQFENKYFLQVGKSSSPLSVQRGEGGKKKLIHLISGLDNGIDVSSSWSFWSSQSTLDCLLEISYFWSHQLQPMRPSVIAICYRFRTEIRRVTSSSKHCCMIWPNVMALLDIVFAKRKLVHSLKKRCMARSPICNLLYWHCLGLPKRKIPGLILDPLVCACIFDRYILQQDWKSRQPNTSV